MHFQNFARKHKPAKTNYIFVTFHFSILQPFFFERKLDKECKKTHFQHVLNIFLQLTVSLVTCALLALSSMFFCFYSDLQFLAEQCFHDAIGIQLFRRGTRFNSEPLACLGWQLCSPLIHCRNHPKYQQLDILAEIDRVSQPSELRDFLARNFVVSR